MHDDPNFIGILLQWCAERKEQVSAFIGMALFGAWGGVMSYIREQKVKKAAIRLTEGLLEAFSAAFVGAMIGMSVLALIDNQLLAMAFAGWAGHEGTRKIFKLVNRLVKSRLEK